MQKMSLNALGTETNTYRFLTYALIAAGICLRAFHFADNRALYLDEVFLAHSLINMDFIELATEKLVYEQKAPLGFLWFTRVSIVLFGKQEMSLRLFSLAAGIAALFAFLPVARHFLKHQGVLISVGILALAPPIIYHATEAKQYSTEMLCTVLALWLYIRNGDGRSRKSLMLWGLGGALLLWFSYSVVLVLAGIGVGVSFFHLRNRNWAAIRQCFLPFAIWVTSFALNFVWFTHKFTSGSEWLVVFFRERGGFMPLPPSSLSDLWWFYRFVFSTLHYPLGLTWFSLPGEYDPVLRMLVSMALIPLGLIVYGLVTLYRRDKNVFLVLVCPIAFALLASGLEIYPSYERFLLYLSPVIVLFISFGAESVRNLFATKRYFGHILVAVVLMGPTINSVWQAATPKLFGGAKRSYQREALLYINDRYKKGDIVYADWTALPAYSYYKVAYSLRYDAIQGRDVRFISKDTADYFNNLNPDLQELARKRRVWLVYSTYYVAKIGDIEGTPDWYYAGDEEFKLAHRLHAKLSGMGKELASYRSYDMNAALFDFSD